MSLGMCRDTLQTHSTDTAIRYPVISILQDGSDIISSGGCPHPPPPTTFATTTPPQFSQLPFNQSPFCLLFLSPYQTSWHERPANSESTGTTHPGWRTQCQAWSRCCEGFPQSSIWHCVWIAPSFALVLSEISHRKAEDASLTVLNRQRSNKQKPNMLTADALLSHTFETRKDHWCSSAIVSLTTAVHQPLCP